MSKNKPQKQHHISQMLLRKFVNSDKQIYLFDSEKRKIEPRNTESVAKKRHLYTVRDKQTKSNPDYSLEEKFAQEESIACAAIERLREKNNTGNGLRDDLEIVGKFLVTLLLRTPKHVEMARQVSEREELQDTLRQNAVELGIGISEADKFIDRYTNKENYLYALTLPTLHKDYWRKFLSEFDIYLIQNETDTPFVLNDNYAVIDTKGKNFKKGEITNWYEAVTAVHCPVAADCIISFMPKSDLDRKNTGNILLHYATIPKQEVQRINEVSYKQKSRYLYGHINEIMRVFKKFCAVETQFRLFKRSLHYSTCLSKQF